MSKVVCDASVPPQQGEVGKATTRRAVAQHNSATAADATMLPESRGLIQLRWLVRIRWAVLMSLVGIFFGANYFLGLELQTPPLYVVFGALALTNLALTALHRPSEPACAMLARSALLVDVLGLGALLYFCGGYTNPFSMMFLAYVTLAAVVLDARWTWIVFVVSLCCFFAVFFVHVPLSQLGVHDSHLHHAHQMQHEGFSLHLHGMLVAFVVIGVVVAFFVTRMSREIAEQAARIEALRNVEDEQRRLLSLATLTAGAAHELATPIATLSLIGEDLGAALTSDPRWSDDIDTMQGELRRCSMILERMRGGGTEIGGEAPTRFELHEVLCELEHDFPSQGDDSVNVSFMTIHGGGHVFIYSLRRALASALSALIKNGVQACAGRGAVKCCAQLTDHEVVFSVDDTGSGMSEDAARRAGEPFFTSKAPGEGMGLGLYLTKLFALQVGGSLTISSKVGHGTQVVLRVPRVMEVETYA
jgi:two-component system sensor histidine kinase RegB